jgi:hypothetical protein
MECFTRRVVSIEYLLVVSGLLVCVVGLLMFRKRQVAQVKGCKRLNAIVKNGQ